MKTGTGSVDRLPSNLSLGLPMALYRSPKVSQRRGILLRQRLTRERDDGISGQDGQRGLSCLSFALGLLDERLRQARQPGGKGTRLEPALLARSRYRYALSQRFRHSLVVRR